MTVDYERLYALTNVKIFDDIFNYSDITLKNNIHLALLNGGKYARSMIYTRLISIVLPDIENDYYLYMCENTVINNLLYNAKSWMNVEDVLNTNKVNIDFVSSDHKMIPKKMIYCILDDNTVTIFAINRKAFKKMSASTDMYITINVDTNLVGNRTVLSHLPGYHENLNGIMNAFDACDQTKCLCFINGYSIIPSKFKTYGNLSSDYYELYIDENIQFTFTIDLDERKTYNSSEENLYKDLVFIPKDLLGNNVYTYDTFSMMVRNNEGIGVFVPFLADKSVSQLTHGCVGISSFVIDSALDKLGVTSGQLELIVSNYSKTNLFIENGSLTEQLYSLDDATITSIISGGLNNDVMYWLADALEKRAYGKCLTEVEDLNTYDQVLIKKQIECLGYFPFVQLLCQQHFELTNLGSPVVHLILNKPEFWNGVSLFPIFYLDGNKVNPSIYDITQTDTQITVTFTSPLAIDFSYSVLNYRFILQTEERTYRKVVTTTDGIVINKHPGMLHVYIKTDNTTLNIDGNAHQTYVVLAIENNAYYSVIETNEQYIFSFKNAALSHEFIFMWDSVTEVNHQSTIELASGQSLFFIPTVNTVGNGSVPVLFDNGFELYLNGRYMVHGIDFITVPLKKDEEIAGYSCVLQNLKFLQESGNIVDLIIMNQKILTSETGYIVDGIIPRSSKNEAWIEGVSRLFINGKLVPFSSVTRTNTHFEIDSRYAGNGYIYHFVNSISNDFYEAYKSFMNTSYFDGRVEISDYFLRDYTYSLPSEIIISNGNKMFSSYLNEVIKRVLHDEVVVNFINDDNDIIHQLDTIEYLKKFDILLADDDLINKRFIDIYPMYLSQLQTDDFNKYLYIRRLVKIIIGTDEISDHLIAYLP